MEKEKLKDCVKGQDGLRYLSDMGNKTAELAPQLRSVPAIAINNVRKHQISLRK
jgi:hypothetical protein